MQISSFLGVIHTIFVPTSMAQKKNSALNFKLFSFSHQNMVLPHYYPVVNKAVPWVSFFHPWVTFFVELPTDFMRKAWGYRVHRFSHHLSHCQQWTLWRETVLLDSLMIMFRIAANIIMKPIQHKAQTWHLTIKWHCRLHPVHGRAMYNCSVGWQT